MTRSKTKKQVVIIMGPPGSGKGTQATLLSEKLNLYHFETSKIIEANLAVAQEGDFVKIGKTKYFLSQEKKLREAGKWMSPPLIAFWMKDKIKELAKERKGIVFSGSPKTLYEAKQYHPLLKEFYGALNIKVILIEQKPAVSIWRNSHRRICELMRHSILYLPETAKLKRCLLDGSKLVNRGKLDKPEITEARLKEYVERTLPIIDFFKKEGLKITKIDGSLTPSIVFNNILKEVRPPAL